MYRHLIPCLLALTCGAPLAAEDARPAPTAAQVQAHRLAKFDKDGDGRLSRDEFINAVMAHEAWIKANRPELYKRLDLDGDGDLTVKDRQALHQRWLERHPELKERLDRNDDGRVSVGERRTADRVEDRVDRRENVRDRAEDRVDRREDVRDRREDVRDAQRDGGLIDDLEDALDRREDVRDRREDGRDQRENVRDRREGVRDHAPGPVGGAGRR